MRYNGYMKTKPQSSETNLETCAPRVLALGLLAILLLALTGCKNQKPAATPSEINPAGVYTLVSVDGKNLPCNLTHEGVAMMVKSGSFTINADGTCRSVSSFSVPPNPDIHREVKAT